MGFLSFLAEPWFIIPWYTIGILSSIWVAYDYLTYNQHVNQALKWAWPIITFFFSIIGLGLYLWTCRPPRIQIYQGEEAKKVHHQYVKPEFRKVIGSAIHCVGGDGLGIITAMVILRLVEVTFWEEFWLEYLAGYLFGWFIFQYGAMRNMGNSRLMAIWKGGRAEFFSMMTVMAGMGAVMGVVTPLVVGEQPDPTTFAFWGFAALGLFVGFILTYPMNLCLVRIGWKHGMS